MIEKIIKLEAENVKRLQAIAITPKGALVVIGGRNAQGKSSTLDAIEYALGGDPQAKMPVRRGQERARIVVDLGDIVVRRTFTTSGGTALVVTNKDGIKQTSPQAILDKLIGKLTFDPFAFARMKPAEAGETLRKLVGLDFAAKDLEHYKLYAQRTVTNRDAKALENQMAGMKHWEDAPAEEVSGASVLEEQRKASEVNRANGDKRRLAKEAATNALAAQTAEGGQRAKIASLENQIRGLMSQLTSAKDELEIYVGRTKTAIEAQLAAQDTAAAVADVDLTPFADRLSKVEADNIHVRENKRRASIVEQYKAKCRESEELTGKMAQIDSDKRRAVSEAKYPIEGLSFDAAGGVELNGIPLDQIAESEKLDVSVAIGLALNPKLRVLLIRDGSLLDNEALERIAKRATEAKAQIWIERVGQDGKTSVVIEDGLAQEVEQEAETEEANAKHD